METYDKIYEKLMIADQLFDEGYADYLIRDHATSPIEKKGELLLKMVEMTSLINYSKGIPSEVKENYSVNLDDLEKRINQTFKTVFSKIKN